MEKLAVRRERVRGRFAHWGLPLAGLFLSGAVLLLAQRSAAFAEWYATRVYPLLVRLIGGMWGLFPFSVGEWVVYGLVAAVLAFAARLTALLVRRERARAALLARRGAVVLLWALCLILVLYTFLCGINYHRAPFSSFSGLQTRPSSAQELAALAEELIVETNALALQMETSAVGTTAIDRRSAVREARAAMRQLGEEYPQLAGYYPAAKPVLFSWGMSHLDITGVYFPLTVEANVNVDVPDYHVPATACHELSHLRGFMREDEANFVAYLACRASGSNAFRYSGNMLALVYVRNALYSADRELSAEVRAKMNARVNADFDENDAYWRQFEGPVATMSNAVNDVYLKVNAQSDGLKSYGRMVDLLLADYRARHALA